jgi:RHS repeat-associated protein
MGLPAARKTDGVAHKKAAGNILDGSPNVKVNGLPAARLGDPVQHNKIVETITQGSASVKANGRPMSRSTDKVACGGMIAGGSGDVLIGTGASGRACSGCPGGVTEGKPVNPIIGAKVLLGSGELDFALPGVMPFVVQRQYSSYVNADHGGSAGLMGYGWKLPVEQFMRLTPEACLLFDTGGRTITFDALPPGGMDYSLLDDLRIMRGVDTKGSLSEAQHRAQQKAHLQTQAADPASDAELQPNSPVLQPSAPSTITTAPPEHPEHPSYSQTDLPWYEQPQWQHIPAVMRHNPKYVFAAGSDRTVWAFVVPNAQAHAPAANYYLLFIIDTLGRMQRLERDEQFRISQVIDGVGRRYTLQYQQILAAPKPETPPSISGPHFQVDSGQRLVGIELTQDPQANNPNFKTQLVRYHYSSAGDLIEVENRYGERVRQFVYQNHLMVEHRERGGPAHRYTYEHSPPLPGDKVIAQDNEDALSYRFEYQDDLPAPGQEVPRSRSIVTDSLGRRKVYYCEGVGGNKRVVTHTRADGSSIHTQELAGQRTINTDALGRSTHVEFDNQGRSTGAIFPDGSRTSLQWDSATGLLTSNTSPSGQSTHYEYDRWGRLISTTTATTAPNGSTTHYHYNDLPDGLEVNLDNLYNPQRLTADLPSTITDPQGGVKHLRWTATGLLASHTDCSGKTTHYQYNALGQVTRITNALGQHFSTDYDELGRVQATHAPDGTTTQVRYTAQGWVSQVIDPAGQVTRFQYDVHGRITARTVGNTQGGLTLGYQYDTASRLTTLINENGATTQFSYDALDRLVQEIGFDGRVISYCYNAAGELQASADGRTLTPHERQSVQAWVNDIARHDSQPKALLASLQSNDTDTTTTMPLLIEALGLQGQASNASNNANPSANPMAATLDQLRLTGYRYDLVSRLTERQVCASHLNTAVLHRFFYDATGPLAKVQALDATTGWPLSDVSRGHDVLGRLTNETQTLFDAQGQSVFQHQIAHRLGMLGQREATTLSGAQSAGGLLGEVGYLTYGSGHLHGVTLDQEPLLSIERDELHREVTRHIPALSLKRAYDTMGRLQTQVVDGLTEGLSRFNNPAAEDPVLKNLPAPAPMLAAQLNRHYHYDKLGQMTGITSPSASSKSAQDVYKRYAYDGAGRLIASIHAGQEKQTNYRFDPAGNRLPEPIPAQYQHMAQNKAQNWAEQVKQNLHNPEFDVLSQDASLFNPESVDRWMDNRVRHSAGTRYDYDRWGNRIQAMHLDGKRQKYSYDGLHQLTQVQCFEGGDLISTTRYRYDVFGRRLAKIVQLAPANANANAVDAKAAQYSNASDSVLPLPAPPPLQTTYFGWDGDRLAHAETETTIQATVYEPDSFVPMLMIHSQKPKLPAPPAELQAMEREFPAVMQELVTTGQIPSGTRELMGKLGLDAEHITAQVQEFKQAQQEALDQAPMSIHHFYCDHLGTPRALFDLHGSPVWLAEYDDWGAVTKEYNPLGLEQNLRFQGQQWDVETGLFYNRFRYYDSQLGRYINQDPIGMRGSLNQYTYPLNPVAYIDVLGLQVVSPAEAERLIKEEGVMPADRKNPFSSSHVYNHSSEICKKTSKNCTKENVHACVKKYPAPGAVGDKEVYNGAVSNVKLPGGVSGKDHVLHGVDDKSLRVTNMTLGDHMLNPGWVTRDTVETGDSIRVDSKGGGDGFNLLGLNSNDYLVKRVWGETDQEVKKCLEAKK